MADQKEYISIGKIIKPHGYKGDVTLRIDSEFIDILNASDHLFLELNSMNVPFFVDSFSSKNNGHFRVKFEDVNSEEESKRLSAKEIFHKIELINELNPNHDIMSEFDGFKVFDEEHGLIGQVEQLADYNGSSMFEIVDAFGQEIMIPFHEDFVISIDPKKKEIKLNLPEGLINLNDED